MNISYQADLVLAERLLSALPVISSSREVLPKLAFDSVLVGGIGTSAGAARLMAELLETKRGLQVRCEVNRCFRPADGNFDLAIIATTSCRHHDVHALIRTARQRATQVYVLCGQQPPAALRTSATTRGNVTFLFPASPSVLEGAFCPVARIVAVLWVFTKVFGLGDAAMLGSAWRFGSALAKKATLPTAEACPLLCSYAGSGTAAAHDLVTREHELGGSKTILIEPLALAHGQYKMAAANIHFHFLLFCERRYASVTALFRDSALRGRATLIFPAHRGVAGAFELYFANIHLVPKLFVERPKQMEWSDGPLWGRTLYRRMGNALTKLYHA